MENKITMIQDKKDIEIQCTEEKIINITGMIGAGKTTKANLYRNDERYIVISLDWVCNSYRIVCIKQLCNICCITFCSI